MGISRRGHRARSRSSPAAGADAPTTAPPSDPALTQPDAAGADPGRPPLTRLRWPEHDAPGRLQRSGPAAPARLPWPEPDAPGAASMPDGVEAEGAHDDGTATLPGAAQQGIASIADTAEERARGQEQVADSAVAASERSATTQPAQVEGAAEIRRAELELAAAVRAVELALAADTRPARR
jgi:hypothetical protein